MAAEQLRYSALPIAVSNVVADVADLFQKEIRLARAEVSQKLAAKIRGGYWMVGAAFLSLLSALVFCQAVVVWLVSFGLTLQASCLILAASLLALAVLAYFAGRVDAREDLTPNRSLHQIKEDIRTTKEHLP